jgi:hypothetical protein
MNDSRPHEAISSPFLLFGFMAPNARAIEPAAAIHPSLMPEPVRTR